MKRALILFGAAIGSLLLPPVGATETASRARAWVVEYQGAQAVIVAETHENLPFELDDELLTSVIPAIRGVGALQVEGVVAPAIEAPDGGFCPGEGDLLPRRAEREPDAALLRRWSASAVADKRAGQFNFITRSLPVQVLLAKLEAKKQHSSRSEWPEQRGVYETLLRAVHGSTPVVGLESFDDRWRAFCSAPAAVRDQAVMESIRHVDRQIEHLGQDLAASGSEAPKRLFDAALGCIGSEPPCSADTLDLPAEVLNEAVRLGLPCGACEATNHVLVKGRNPPMATHILQAMIKYRRTVVLVGAAHLPTLKYSDGAGPGLIELLRAGGASVHPLGVATWQR